MEKKDANHATSKLLFNCLSAGSEAGRCSVPLKTKALKFVSGRATREPRAVPGAGEGHQSVGQRRPRIYTWLQMGGPEKCHTRPNTCVEQARAEEVLKQTRFSLSG